MKHFIIFAMLLAACVLTPAAKAQGTETKTETKTDGIQILDAKLGTDVKDKEIVGEESNFALNTKVWILFKVKGAANEELTVTWKNGDMSKEIQLTVGGSPWRTWSAKTASKAGDWTVTIADSKGNSLKELKFTVK